MMTSQKVQPMTIERAMNDPKNQGKHIIVVAGKLFTANTGDGASRILDRVMEEYPKETPTYTYLPPAGTLILFYEA